MFCKVAISVVVEFIQTENVTLYLNTTISLPLKVLLTEIFRTVSVQLSVTVMVTVGGRVRISVRIRINICILHR